MSGYAPRKIPSGGPANHTIPVFFSPDVLATVHHAAYVRAVQTGEPHRLAESSGFHWDAGLWTSVCASNGGAVTAARAALASNRNAGSRGWEARV